jgi:hypothetical protein
VHPWHNEEFATPALDEYEPATHNRQFAVVFDPNIVEYAPAVHFVQFAVPGALEKDPAGQARQLSETLAALIVE